MWRNSLLAQCMHGVRTSTLLFYRCSSFSAFLLFEMCERIPLRRGECSAAVARRMIVASPHNSLPFESRGRYKVVVALHTDLCANARSQGQVKCPFLFFLQECWSRFSMRLPHLPDDPRASLWLFSFRPVVKGEQKSGVSLKLTYLLQNK